jgi:YfiH family protein
VIPAVVRLNFWSAFNVKGKNGRYSIQTTVKTNEIQFRIFQDYPEIKCHSLWQIQNGLNRENELDNHSFGDRGFIPDNMVQGRAVLAKQIHGTEVVYVTNPGVVNNCDGLFTREQKLNLVIRTADCAAVMIYDPDSSAIVNLHVGWRGAHSGIIHRAFADLKKKAGGDSRLYRIAVGPAIHSCCYRVGKEFYQYFDESSLELRNDQLFFDLPAVIRRQLLTEGTVSGNIEISDQCTLCSTRLLPSYRRNKTRQRIWNMIEKEGDTT